jgi:hypothetical protein
MNGSVTILIIIEKAVILKENLRGFRYTIDIQFRKIAWNQNLILWMTVPSERVFSAGKSGTENHYKHRKINEKKNIS